MWQRTFLVTIAICCSVPADAKIYNANFIPTAGQLSRYERGVQSIESRKQWTTVRVVEILGADKKASFFSVYVLNTGHQSFAFGPANIIVRPSATQPLPLITYEQAMGAERKKEGHEKFWSGVAAVGRGLAASSAGTTYGSGMYQGTSSGWVGNNLVTANSIGTFSYTAQDPVAQQMALRNAALMNHQARANLEEKWAERASAREALLRTATVDPGIVSGGVAAFTITDELREAKGPIPITIEVNVEGEKHIFVGEVSATD